MSDLILRASDLHVGYGRRTVLHAVDLQIGAAEFWVLLGPNGEGKTTFLRAVLGEISPRSGELWLRPDLRDRTAIGFVPQRCDLNPNLPTTVREFVLLGLVGIRLAPPVRWERLTSALAQAGLQGSEGRDYWSLSGGQRQRALVARALVRRPKLLVLDEPTSNLDFAIQETILDLLTEIRQQHGTTILLVSHDLDIARRRATHVALLRAGRVVAGRPEDLLTHDNLHRLFGLSVATPLAGIDGAHPGRDR